VVRAGGRDHGLLRSKVQSVGSDLDVSAAFEN
jgi:hypothetical protein